MIKAMFNIILLILIFGLISISPQTRYSVGISLNKFLRFFYELLNYQDREKSIIAKPSWITSQKLKPLY